MTEKNKSENKLQFYIRKNSRESIKNLSRHLKKSPQAVLYFLQKHKSSILSLQSIPADIRP